MKIYQNKGHYYFMCPGCGCSHQVNDTWDFNQDLDRPTFSPSILVKSGHYAEGHNGECWCIYNEKHPEDPFTCCICHSFVTDGKIQYLGDCTHELAGKTVELPEWTT